MIKSSIFWGTAVSTALCAVSEEEKMNVLFIAVDDLRNELGCYGIDEIKTPNIDKLASKSVTFSNHFVQVPTSGASRGALLTGRRPGSSASMSNHSLTSGDTKLSQTMQVDGAQTLPEIFKRSGYHTVQIGKISHMPDGKVYNYDGTGDGRDELPHAWTELATPYGIWGYAWGSFFAYADGKHREDGTGFKPVMQFPDVADNGLPDGMMCDTAIAKIDEIKDSPFFMAVGFYKPHLPFVAPKKYRDIYNDVDVQIAPVQGRNGTSFWHSSSEFYKYSDFSNSNPLSRSDQIEAKKAYYACVSYIDAQVGRLLEKLESTGLGQNTIIVLWGDHGWHLGDHAMWGKHNALEKSLRSPLIIFDPRNTVSGKSDAVVETIDIFPTLVDLCAPSFNKSCFTLGGSSLRPVLEDINHPGKNGSISYWGSSRSLRRGDFRLVTKRLSSTSYTNFELYNHKNDPHETTNIAAQNPTIKDHLLSLIMGNSPVISDECLVTFDLGEFSTRTGGGDLLQLLSSGSAPEPPEISVQQNWVFLGWDTQLSSINGNTVITALYDMTDELKQIKDNFIEVENVDDNQLFNYQTELDKFYVIAHQDNLLKQKIVDAVNSKQTITPINLVTGWNLIGVPYAGWNFYQAMEEYNASYTVYTYQNGSYHLKEVSEADPFLATGHGYWVFVYAGDSGIIPLVASGIAQGYCPVNFYKGWNITSPVRTTPFKELSSDYQHLHNRGWLWGNSQSFYEMVDTMQPGNGYWISSEVGSSVEPYSVNLGTLSFEQSIINFNDYTILSYVESQDGEGSVEVKDNGKTLHLTGNVWKCIEFDYTVTPNTIIEFDFKSNVEPEESSIGFDNDKSLSAGYRFKLYGFESNDKVINDFKNYSPNTRGVEEYNVKRYVIPVGQYYTGNMLYLTFVNDHDGGDMDGESIFSDIRIYENQEN